MKKTVILLAAALLSFNAFAQKSATVNFAELVQLAPEADEARATLKEAQQEAAAEHQRMLDEFQTKYQEYQQKVNTWSQAIRDTKVKELTAFESRIQDFEQNIQQELQQQSQALMAPIYKKAQEVVNSIAEKGGYSMVFDVTNLLYVDKNQCPDITPEARTAMGIAPDRTLEALQQELAAQE